ncbi:amino acid dehydrogenase [Kineobactrum sediminis]|uniref:Amino acid dehydrogenase n=1 Tax=Kineobactrum sediminis TaxID=1905677 RepID=A0A2N5Y0Z2_9GAMM|nr:Glu/Leu/Phe/Val dehydrogenase dimerization domain-containing protein [Kineobactrum sediminis]PLW82065.1 amino acid dehydrogenase [Kineobactrum sediminis]
MSVFTAPAFDQHERVVFGSDRTTGLRAIIAVHDTTLGPGVGGCRMFPYLSDAAALHDVLRLSRGMTYKSALAGLPLGGGKSVIIGDSRRDKTPALMHAMGEFIDSQGGSYVAAEDSGTGVADIKLMAERTRHVSGVSDNEFGGDPSPSTALGVYLGIRTAIRHRLGAGSCAGLRVAIQGLGHVGFHLARLLCDEGAVVFGADLNKANLQRAVDQLGVIPVAVDDILFMEVDILAPCAMGAVLDNDSIPRLRAGIVAGAANNQLAAAEHCAQLQDHGILYCPDFLINAGGIIDVHHQRVGSADTVRLAHVKRIEITLAEVLRRSDASRSPTHEIAEELAREYLRPADATAERRTPLVAAG